MFSRKGRFEMWRKFEIILGLFLTVVICLCISTSTVRQHHWHRRHTDSLCDLPTTFGGQTVVVNTLAQCLAHVQPQYRDGGVVTFNVTSGLCMIPDPTAMSNTFGEMYESEMAQLVVEDPIPEPCNNSWTKTFQMQSNGIVGYGNKISLVEILDKGADVKVQLGDNLFLELAYVSQRGSERCVVSPYVISKSNWDTIDPDVFWKMTHVCTNGDIYITKQLIGHSVEISSGYELMDITWYTRNIPEDPNQGNPIYCNLDSGLKSCGSKQNLLSAVKKGKHIKLWIKSGLPSSTSLHRLEIDTQANDCNAIGHIVFRLGLDTHRTTLSVPLYWWHALFSTLGTAEITRWYVGKYVNKRDSSSAYDLHWYVDVCWSFVFKHSDSGIQISGSHESLEAHILVGRRVRILFDSYILEADNLLISNTRLITAQLLSQMDTSTPMTFSPGYWKWVRISTDGSFFTDIYQMGSSTKVSGTESSITASWFVERRGWNRILVTSPNGTAMEGSKIDLVNQIRLGSKLRCAVIFNLNNMLVFTADTIEIHSDGNVAAQMFRYIEFNDGTPGSFVPYWRIMLICTTGKLQESRWTVGEHVKRGEVLHDVTTYWFVDT